MLMLGLGLAIFFAAHLVPTRPRLRERLRASLGVNGYKAAFALFSLIGFVVIVLGYHKLQLAPGKNPVIWQPPLRMRDVTFTLMLPAMILLVASFIPSRIRTMARHPMLVAIKLWALAHLLVNGRLGAMVLFASFLAFAVFDRISLKRRGALGPLGSATAPGILNDVVVVVLGCVLYGLMLTYGHAWLIAHPLLPGFGP